MLEKHIYFKKWIESISYFYLEMLHVWKKCSTYESSTYKELHVW